MPYWLCPQVTAGTAFACPEWGTAGEAEGHIPLYQAKAEFFGMPGHPVRMRVLELLQDGPMPVRDLLAAIEVEPSSLSQQLELMRAARQILTEMLAGRNELLAELREAEVAAR